MRRTFTYDPFHNHELLLAQGQTEQAWNCSAKGIHIEANALLEAAPKDRFCNQGEASTLKNIQGNIKVKAYTIPASLESIEVLLWSIGNAFLHGLAGTSFYTMYPFVWIPTTKVLPNNLQLRGVADN